MKRKMVKAIMDSIEEWLLHLFLIFAVLKCCGLIDWPWLMALVPVFVTIALSCISGGMEVYHKNHSKHILDSLMEWEHDR